MSKQQEQGFGVYSAQSGKAVRLAMQELWLAGTVLPVGARLVVRHTFQSGEKKPLEAVYAFALPRDAAMRNFKITGDNFSVESSLKRTSEARETYEKGLEEGHLSAMAQQYGDGVVNLSIGNIRPGETVTVYLELAAGVSCTDSGLRFRFPFTLAPGYHARAAYGTTDDGEGEIALPEDIFGDVILPRWRQDGKDLHRVGFDLSVALPMEHVEIASPSHPVSARLQSPSSARVVLATEADVPDRDLVLDVRCDLAVPRAFSGMDLSGKGRFAALLPSTVFGPVADGPKKVVFLIDHSGSMDGRPFEQAKRATLACIAALRPEDHFGIVFFETKPTAFPPGCTEAGQEQREAARAFVDGMKTAGGTELSAGLDKAVQLLTGGGDILLLTDGQVYETRTIIARARKAGARVHCLGIGSASQDRFLALLARETGGASHFATPRERVDEAALRLFGAIGVPAAERLRCEVTGLPGVRLVPEPPPVARVNEPVPIFGSCDGPGEGILHVAWDGGSLETPLVITSIEEIVDRDEASLLFGEALKLIQGARLTTAAEMMDDEKAETRRAAARIEKQREKRWIQLAEEYGLANPAMSLVAVVERAGDQPGDVPVTRVVPVGMPQDTEIDSYFAHPLGMTPPTSRVASLFSPVVCHCVDKNERYEDASLGIPTFLRRHRTVEKTDSNEAGLLDLLFGMVVTIEVDGGLPGQDMEERIAHTLAGILVLLDYERNSGEQGFAAHARRMTDFLHAHEAEPLPQERDALLRQALAAIDNNQVPEGDWCEAYARLGEKPEAPALWHWIASIFH